MSTVNSLDPPPSLNVQWTLSGTESIFRRPLNDHIVTTTDILAMAFPVYI